MCPQLVAICVVMVAAAVAMFVTASLQRAAATRDVPADRRRNHSTVAAGVLLLAMAGGVFTVVLVRCMPRPAPPSFMPAPATQPASTAPPTQP